RKLCDGENIAILSIGAIGNNVSKVIDELMAENIKVAHYDMIFLKPLDDDMLKEIGNKFRRVITIEDGTITGGLGSAIMEWFNDHNVAVHVSRIGIPDAFINQGTVEQLYQICGMDNNSIKSRILQELQED
ncbi:MAG: transketolase C-terminal domain-containing protein, partial [Muribaculaceae bacterium]